MKLTSHTFFSIEDLTKFVNEHNISQNNIQQILSFNDKLIMFYWINSNGNIL